MKSVQKSILLSYDTYQRLLDRSVTTPHDDGGRETPEQTTNLTNSDILEVLPKKYRYRVEAILTYISRDPKSTLAWNERGELIYKGTTIQRSHIVDLLKDTQYHHKNYTPLGTDTFYKGLEEIYLPTTLIVKRDVTLRPPGLPIEKKRKQQRKKWIHL